MKKLILGILVIAIIAVIGYGVMQMHSAPCVVIFKTKGDYSELTQIDVDPNNPVKWYSADVGPLKNYTTELHKGYLFREGSCLESAAEYTAFVDTPGMDWFKLSDEEKVEHLILDPFTEYYICDLGLMWDNINNEWLSDEQFVAKINKMIDEGTLFEQNCKKVI